MPESAAPHALNGQPRVRTLKLSMPSLDRRQAEMQGPEAPNATHLQRTEEPRRPSYSPVTPTISQTSLPSLEPAARPSPQWIDEPKPLPVSLDENPDAIALRATISILQIQRQQGLKDIQALEQIKHAALEQPGKFVEDLKAGKLTKPAPVGIVNTADSDDDMADTFGKTPEESRSASNVHGSQFGKFPTAQNIVRAPAINWDKYHVVGESLDKLHEQQRRRPGSNDVLDEHGRLPPEHVIAAPYRPFVDKLEPLPPKSAQGGGKT